MTHRIKVITQFDITATGTRNRLSQHQLPFEDNAGVIIKNQADWQFSRNQQINWETLNQLISLRALPENISIPLYDQVTHSWSFVFEIPDILAVGTEDEQFKYLLADCDGVPMLTNLNELIEDVFLKTDPVSANIRFQHLSNN